MYVQDRVFVLHLCKTTVWEVFFGANYRLVQKDCLHIICVSCRFVFRLYRELIGLLKGRRACVLWQSVSAWILDHYACAVHEPVSVFMWFITTCGKIAGDDVKLCSARRASRSTVRLLNLITQPSNGCFRMKLWFLIDSKVKDAASFGGRTAYQS